MKKKKIGFWTVQTDIGKAFASRGCATVDFDFHDVFWHKQAIKADCDAYVWYPHLHDQWEKLKDRAGFIESYLGKKVFPSLHTSYLFQDKLHQKYVFDLYNIPTPKTALLVSEEQARVFFSTTQLPVVVKHIWGFGGEATRKRAGVFLLKTKKDVQTFLQKKKWPTREEHTTFADHLYVQEYVHLTAEYRVVTVGQKVLLAYEKKSDAFLKHVWRGAEMVWKVDPRVQAFVRDANKRLRLDWCGWDVVRNARGKLTLLELNPIFGTASLEQKGIHLADHLVEYVLKHV